MNLIQNFSLGRKKALITGVTGQDGAYLSELLLSKGYEVHGVKRRSSSLNTGRIDHLYQDPHESELQFVLHHGDMTDTASLIRIMQQVQPDEVYNLAAQSHVAVSFEKKQLAFIRLLHQSYSEKFKKHRNARRLPSTLAAHMQPLNCMPTGLPSTTARLTTCMPVTAYCLIMNQPCGEKPSSLEKSLELSQRFH
jgi:hypothetical protein